MCSAQKLEESESPETEGGGVAREEEERHGVTTMEEVLTQLNLDGLIEAFQKEQIDFDSLVSHGKGIWYDILVWVLNSEWNE